MRYFIYCRKSSEGEERQVLSLASQQEALARSFGDNPDVEIVGLFEEAKSAKTPGRPLFAEMLKRIEAGEADGIASWAPDRLARNSIDGGHIIYLLDRGVLRDLKFATYTFESNSQGKFMLGIMFNQSKYYSDALSENVQRGNATKVAMGWRPNRPPLGYLNCTQTRTIIPDPELFPLVRKIFDLFLTGAYNPRQIVKIARDDWGFLTPRKLRNGGTPLGRSTVYQMLSNPFYQGTFAWAGTVHTGRHQAVVTTDEFARVQGLLGRSHVSRPANYTYAFAGLITCGKCARAITTEQKLNRYGTRYVYYHCAARGRLVRACGERSIEEAELTKQFRAFLASIVMSTDIASWVRGKLQADQERNAANTASIAEARRKALAEISVQLTELTSLRLRRMMDDHEFASERARLEASRLALLTAPDPESHTKLIELLDITQRISVEAVNWFDRASPSIKQKILKILCSNPSVGGQKLSIEAAKPFVIRGNLHENPRLLGVVEEDRTLTRDRKLLKSNLKEIQRLGGVDETLHTFTELKRLCLGEDHLPRAGPTRASPVHLQPLLPTKAASRYRSRKPL